jgi:hypothetical protein
MWRDYLEANDRFRQARTAFTRYDARMTPRLCESHPSKMIFGATIVLVAQVVAALGFTGSASASHAARCPITAAEVRSIVGGTMDHVPGSFCDFGTIIPADGPEPAQHSTSHPFVVYETQNDLLSNNCDSYRADPSPGKYHARPNWGRGACELDKLSPPATAFALWPRSSRSFNDVVVDGVQPQVLVSDVHRVVALVERYSG